MPGRLSALCRPALAKTVSPIILGALPVAPDGVQAQRFYADNQWVAPQGVATLVGIAATEYSRAIATVALVPEWEVNPGYVHTYDDPLTDSSNPLSLRRCSGLQRRHLPSRAIVPAGGGRARKQLLG